MAQYITTDEMPKYGINANFLSRYSVDDIEMAIAAASSEADCYLSAIYKTPLDEIPPAVKLHVARSAVYHLMSVNGFSATGADEIVVRNYERAIQFFKEHQKAQQLLPQAETSPKRDEPLVAVASSPRRW